MLPPMLLLQIQSICKKYPEIKKLIVFGSFARGDESRASDLDLCVEGLIDRNRFLEFQNDLTSRLLTLRKIDLLLLEDLPPKLLAPILQEGKTIYEAIG